MLFRFYVIFYFVFVGFYSATFLANDNNSGPSTFMFVFNAVLFAWNVKLDIENYKLMEELADL